jgi:hypothetical protein
MLTSRLLMIYTVDIQLGSLRCLSTPVANMNDDYFVCTDRVVDNIRIAPHRKRPNARDICFSTEPRIFREELASYPYLSHDGSGRLSFVFRDVFVDPSISARARRA